MIKNFFQHHTTIEAILQPSQTDNMDLPLFCILVFFPLRNMRDQVGDCLGKIPAIVSSIRGDVFLKLRAESHYIRRESDHDL